jgi:DNA polymerase-3 subunit chi
VSAAPRVEFRVGVADPLGYCCGLLRAADAKGARTVVCAPPAWIDELDQRLWTFSQPDFLAHCRVGEPLEARSPIVLSERADVRGLQGRDCLVNLGTEEVLGWRQLPRVIELVGADAPAKAAARERFRMYRSAGCEPHNVEP